MNEVLFKWSGYSVYTVSFLIVMGFFMFGFVMYKKGLEYRYSTESLIDLAIMSGIFGLLGSRIFFVLSDLNSFSQNWLRVFLLAKYPGYDYLGLILGIIVACLFMSKRGEFKLYEALDLVGLGLPLAVSVERLGRVLGNDYVSVWGMPIEVIQSLMFLLIFVCLWRLEPEYRTFDWYRSRKTQAKSGFIFGGYLFLSGWILLSNLWPTFSKSMMIVSLVSILSGVVLIYVQSGRNIYADVKLIKIVKRWYTRSK